jgi:hypothetical protein
MKSANLNFLEPSGPIQACNGAALPYYMKKSLEEECCCTVTMSRVNVSHFSTNLILIEKPGFIDRAD